ncbi:hypothetical protein HELRODRAFT_67268 [Helobdella robusta]|uniref:Protein kinase domain-containing protein n=1 Tax=Helobdella robusta TaxID=6412 RepID=T1FYZ1_HELRO|nr:hypothetical protein HELRODRAFT_67268 [Helobdella robusta]ESN98745.1 hypothetical protein HELRODRAFT_67268 [Helobdella robusta]
MLRKIRHTNIVHMIGDCRKGDNLYLIIEIMANGSLLNMLRNDAGSTIETQDLIKIALQVVCSAMKYLEKNFIAHRDLAARNVLVSKYKNVFKVSDFGMALDLNQNNLYKQASSKVPVRWTAPEVLRNKNHELRSDVWSYGILLVEIFSFGETPYQEWNVHEVVNRVLDGCKHRQPRNCPNNVYAIMSQCWFMEPKRRPSFVELFSLFESLISGHYQLYLTVDGC